MHRSVFVDRSEAERTTFGEALERYAREVTASKRGWETEMHRINALKRHPLAVRSMASLRGADFAKLRDDRLKECTRPLSNVSWSLFLTCSTPLARTGLCRLTTPSLVSANHQQGSTGSADSPRMSKSGCLRPRMKAKRERFCSASFWPWKPVPFGARKGNVPVLSNQDVKDMVSFLKTLNDKN